MPPVTHIAVQGITICLRNRVTAICTDKGSLKKEQAMLQSHTDITGYHLKFINSILTYDWMLTKIYKQYLNNQKQPH
jgi:hypothetical protein